MLGHGAVVLLISDGWDAAIRILSVRSSVVFNGAVIASFSNAFLGHNYAPLTRGMQAALPFVDDFLPVHNLSSLEALAAHLNALPSRRTGSRRRRTLEP